MSQTSDALAAFLDDLAQRSPGYRIEEIMAASETEAKLRAAANLLRRNTELEDIIEHLTGLLADKEYIRTLADYQRGHLSYAGQLEARERRQTKTPPR